MKTSLCSASTLPTLTRILGVGILSVSPLVLADWNPGDPAKWFQLPDLGPTGLDINATISPGQFGTPGRIVADDFLCTATGPITDIHIWGSWLNDVVTTAPLQFHLSIHADIPADPTGINWSHPGAELWSITLAPTASRIYQAGVQERFWDGLNQPDPIGTDTVVWQHNFLLDPAQAFVQTAGTIYWLDVQAVVGDTATFWGWKTRDPLTGHDLDDAAWNETLTPGGPTQIPDWSPLVYLDGPFNGQSIDMAFALTTSIPEPSTWAAAGVVGLMTGWTLWRRVRR